jgi:hypothetical protein
MDTTEASTWEREVRALEAASLAYPDAVPVLITHDQSPPTRRLPGALQWFSAAQWLMEDSGLAPIRAPIKISDPLI